MLLRVIIYPLLSTYVAITKPFVCQYPLVDYRMFTTFLKVLYKQRAVCFDGVLSLEVTPDVNSVRSSEAIKRQ